MLRDVYFETNKATLLPESEARLDEAGAALEKFADLKVEVQGHTDSRGTAKYNEKLSQARAEAVREYLLAHFHLAADNLIAKGYGESQLAVSPEKSDEDYAMNRRVVLRAINAEVLPQGRHDRAAGQVARGNERSPRGRKARGLRVRGPRYDADHRQRHLEALGRLERVRDVRGHEDHLARPQVVGRAAHGDLRPAVEDLHQRVERRGVLAQALALVEGEHGHVAGRPS